jgi:hypothetical protein
MKSKHFLLLTFAFLNFLIMSCNKDLEYNNAIELRSSETPEVKPNILPYLPNSIKYVRGYVSSKSGSYTGKGLDPSMKKISTFILLILLIQTTYSQNFGDFPKIAKEKLHRDLDLLYQGLDKFSFWNVLVHPKRQR